MGKFEEMDFFRPFKTRRGFKINGGRRRAFSTERCETNVRSFFWKRGALLTVRSGSNPPGVDGKEL